MADLHNTHSFTLEALRALGFELLARVRELEGQLAARDAEIARLKGLKGRPDIEPSGMEPGTKAPAEPSPGPRRGGGNKMARRERWLTPDGQSIAALIAGPSVCRTVVERPI